jgi:diaminopimelate decarboxylase
LVYKKFLISAVKCNDNLLVLEVLAALGANFDCASKVNIKE